MLAAPQVPLRPFRRGCTLEPTAFPGDLTAMARLFTVLAHALRQPALSAIAAAAIALPALSTSTFARGPENIADVAEKVIDAVVNISTSQKVEARAGSGSGGGQQAVPQLPPGSPFEEFFEEFFKNRRGQGGDDQTPN